MMKLSTLALLASSAVLLLAACGDDVSLGSDGSQLPLGAACNTCSGPVQSDAKLCGDTAIGRACLSRGDGTCGYDFPACPGPVGSDCTTCTGAMTEDAKLCPDGSGIGRKCLYRADGTCGYDFPACPTKPPAGTACTTCTGGADKDAKLCPDGTSVGRQCLYAADGTCGFEFPACPGTACSTCTGETTLEAKICDDGAAVGKRCLHKADGTCGFDFPACPGTKCATCTGGVQTDAKLCPDGTGVGRECLFRADLSCGYDFPACPSGGTSTCTGWAGVTDQSQPCDPVSCKRQVCGKDGKVYADECAAGGADTFGQCAAPAGTFACGGHFCQKGVEMCLRREGGLSGGRCAPLPAACKPTPSCGCVDVATQNCGPSTSTGTQPWGCTSCKITDGELTLSHLVP